MSGPLIRKTRVAAYGLITRDEEILLCRLTKSAGKHEGFWTLPGGGVEFGESPPAAMIREVEEETGLVVVANGIAEVNSIVLPIEQGEQHNIHILYLTTVVGGELRSETNGSTDRCEWWNRWELPSVVGLVDDALPLAFPEDS